LPGAAGPTTSSDQLLASRNRTARGQPRRSRGTRRPGLVTAYALDASRSRRRHRGGQVAIRCTTLDACRRGGRLRCGVAYASLAAGEPSPPFASPASAWSDSARYLRRRPTSVTVAFTVTAHAAIETCALASSTLTCRARCSPRRGPGARREPGAGAAQAGEPSRVCFVPQFRRLPARARRRVGGSAGEWTFFGASGIDTPSYMPPAPSRRRCSRGHRERPGAGRQGSQAVLYVRVRNLGSGEGRGLGVPARGARQERQAHRHQGPRAPDRCRRRPPGVVDGARSASSRSSSRGSWASAGVQRRPRVEGAPPEKLLAGGSFAGAAEVELAQFTFNGRRRRRSRSAAWRGTVSRPQSRTCG